VFAAREHRHAQVAVRVKACACVREPASQLVARTAATSNRCQAGKNRNAEDPHQRQDNARAVRACSAEGVPRGVPAARGCAVRRQQRVGSSTARKRAACAVRVRSGAQEVVGAVQCGGRGGWVCGCAAKPRARWRSVMFDPHRTKKKTVLTRWIEKFTREEAALLHATASAPRSRHVRPRPQCPVHLSCSDWWVVRHRGMRLLNRHARAMQTRSSATRRPAAVKWQRKNRGRRGEVGGLVPRPASAGIGVRWRSPRQRPGQRCCLNCTGSAVRRAATAIESKALVGVVRRVLERTPSLIHWQYRRRWPCRHGRGAKTGRHMKCEEGVSGRATEEENGGTPEAAGEEGRPVAACSSSCAPTAGVTEVTRRSRCPASSHTPAVAPQQCQRGRQNTSFLVEAAGAAEGSEFKPAAFC